MLADTWDGIGLFQPFDGHIPKNKARSDAGRYVMTWGTDEPLAWRSGNSAISAGYYLPFDTDADVRGFGGLGHTLTWWQSGNRADWVLYRCDRTTPAWVSGLPDNVPLDISNPAVVAYQMGLVVPYVQADGYTSLTVDVLSLQNGQGGCGIWKDHHTRWVSKFSGDRKDTRWSAAVMYWAGYAQWYLHAQAPQLPIVVNTPAWVDQGDPDEEALIARIDGFDDEGGFTGFGNHLVDERSFVNRVWWAEYIQSHGKAYLVTDLWQHGEPDPVQRDFAVSTYLMGKEHQAAMVTSRYGNYGVEHYWPEFDSPIGSPCGQMYSAQGAYLRNYTGALAIFNPTSSTISLTLPKGASDYRDMEGRRVTNPLPVLQDDGYVLLTASGCS